MIGIQHKQLSRIPPKDQRPQINYSAWAAPIVAVKKATCKVQSCADFSTGLNAALDKHQFPLPVPEDRFAKLNGENFYANLDLSDAYLQLEVAEESREILTIKTHCGLFQFTRLPFGVKPTPAIFQQTVDTMLTGNEGDAA
ncbi:unnamed protein product [Schistocephalus solidus]|uniref:Reverse transcriptase domain-containing protein n=1 Tax=Schistocephalus solidus TaxID=70667 RepID=A0A183S8R3_SCHSO|nr:unnamed protein product [Schistocephalus solidus]